MDGAGDLPASSILTRGPSPGLPVVLEGVFPGRMVLVPCNRHPESSQVWYNCHFRLVRMTKVVGEKQPLTNSCDHPAADGVRPQAVGTTAQPYTASRPAFVVAAVRKSAEEVPLRFIDVLRFAPDIVRSQPRTASLLSGNSVLRADFIRIRYCGSVAAEALRRDLHPDLLREFHRLRPRAPKWPTGGARASNGQNSLPLSSPGRN